MAPRAIRVLAHLPPLSSVPPSHTLFQPPCARTLPLACVLDTGPGSSLWDRRTGRDQTILEAVFTAQTGQ